MSMTMNILRPLMILKQTYKTVTWLTVAIYAMLAVNSFAGQVLCVGDDNHIQLEPMVESCSSFETPHMESSELLSGNSDQPACGTCSDVGLGQVNSIRPLARIAEKPDLVMIDSPAWSFTTFPFAFLLNKQTYFDTCLPAETQPKLSVSTAILIC